MGKKLLDQYSYLHFAVGIVIYFWGINLKNWFILHVIFEIVENSNLGMNLINNYIKFWPGGKPKSDSLLNMTGDTIAGMLGWISAYYIDNLGKKYNLYDLHIKI